MSSTFSTGSESIGTCDRCKFKRMYQDLRADGACPGLRVCNKCWDQPNPFLTWQPDLPQYVLQFPRPDQLLTTTYQYVLPNSPVLAAQRDNYYRAVIDEQIDSNKVAELQTQGNPPRDAWINAYIPPSLLPGFNAE